MKKVYSIFLSFFILIFLSSYNPYNLDLTNKNNNNFLKVEKIEIINNSLIKKTEIKTKLRKIYNKNIFFINRKDVEEPLKGINFLKKVEVKKKYPNTIVVKIFETKPTAILYKNKDKYLLDDLSNLMLLENYTNFDKLPNIFGEGAEIHFLNFFNELKNSNFPIQKIKNFYFFQIVRWDLQLLNDKIVKFPSNINMKIIKKSIELLARKDFENYKIIDLRVDDKIIVE